MYEAGKITGYAFGIGIGLILVLVLLKLMNKDRKVKTRYDEKQEIARGKGFKVAFFTVIIYDAIAAFIVSAFSPLAVSNFFIHFFGVLLGVTVFASYCIWADAYIGLNTNAPRFYIICVFIGLLNVVIAVINFRAGVMIVDGVLQESAINLVTGLVFLVIGVQLIIKNRLDAGRSAEDNEED